MAVPPGSRVTRQDRPRSFRTRRSRLIWVVLPEPSIPSKVTNKSYDSFFNFIFVLNPHARGGHPRSMKIVNPFWFFGGAGFIPARDTRPQLWFERREEINPSPTLEHWKGGFSLCANLTIIYILKFRRTYSAAFLKRRKPWPSSFSRLFPSRRSASLIRVQRGWLVQ